MFAIFNALQTENGNHFASEKLTPSFEILQNAILAIDKGKVANPCVVTS